MPEVLKCAICGQVIDQNKDIIRLQNNLFGNVKQYVYCKNCDNYFETYIRPLIKWYQKLEKD